MTYNVTILSLQASEIGVNVMMQTMMVITPQKSRWVKQFAPSMEKSKLKTVLWNFRLHRSLSPSFVS